MAYSIIKTPSVQIDLMVLEKYWARLASDLQRCGCTYVGEEHTKASNGNTYIVIRDIQAKHGNELGEALALFFGMEWHCLDTLDSSSLTDKFYVLIKPKKRVKKNVQKDRKETGTGSKGRDSGKPADIQSGKDAGAGTGGSCADNSGAQHCEQLSFFEETSDNDAGDQ